MSALAVGFPRHALAIACGAWACPGIAASGAAASWAAVYDFMVQDVCLDTDGRPIMGLSPLDRDCKRHRDLQPGEALPYHKSDWPGDEDKRQQPAGYERSDSFPVRSRMLGSLVVQTFDFGTGGGRKFGAFDRADGGQVVAFSDNSASIILTEDGGGGLQLMAGSKCSQTQATGARLLDSWVIVANGPGAIDSGSTLAKLRIVKDSSCPTGFDHAYTEWHTTSLQFRSSLNGDMTAALRTLVSSHFGGENPQSADHLERLYFTRELGWTRWERWQNAKYSKDPEHIAAAAGHLSASGRCRSLEPAPGKGWSMIDCREWTNIVKPDAKAGDEPLFWVNRLRTYDLTKDLFADLGEPIRAGAAP